MKIDYKAVLIAATVFPSVGATLLAYHYGQKNCPPCNQSVGIEQKVDSNETPSCITNPDKEAQQALEACKTPEYRKKFNECYTKHIQEGCIDNQRKIYACDFKAHYNVCSAIASDLAYDDCVEIALKKGYERFKQQMNIPQR